jgi:hypothetical protein
MELRQLHHFLALVEEGSLTDVAVCLDPQPVSDSEPSRSSGREWGAELFAPNGRSFSGPAGRPSCEVGLVTLSGVGLRRPVVAFLDAYREQCRLGGRGDHEASAAPPRTSVQLS